MGISILQSITPAPLLSDTAAVALGTVAAPGVGALGSRFDHVHPYNDTGWIVPTLLNGWVQYHNDWGQARYRRLNGIVFLSGLVKNGTLGADLFILPAGFRPSHQKLFAIERNPNVNGRIDIYPDGRVVMGLTEQGWTSISDIIFPAEQ